MNHHHYTEKSAIWISRRRWLAFGFMAAFGAQFRSAQATAGPESGLKALLTAFRRCRGLSAHFHEAKQIALLAAPLHSEGKVYFHPSGALARMAETPRESHLLITRSRLVVKDESGRKEIALGDKPALRALVGSLLRVFSGDEAGLAKDFETRFDGNAAEAWQLDLKPKSAELGTILRSIHFSGVGIRLTELRVIEATGDTTTSTFSKVDPERQFSAAETARFFEL
jgi:hypothetical protein